MNFCDWSIWTRKDRTTQSNKTERAVIVSSLKKWPVGKNDLDR